MARQMSPAREQEFNELSLFSEFLDTHIRGIDPSSPNHPTNSLKRIVDAFGRSKALEGLKQAINDDIEMLSDKPANYIQKLDLVLTQHGIITFSEIRRRYASAYKRILKRGIIKSDTEYYLINGIVVDVSSPIDLNERCTLIKLVEQYEQANVVNKN